MIDAQWNFRRLFLKNLLLLLIEKFGLREVNDRIAQVLYERAIVSKDDYWDGISELYDEINRELLRREMR